MRPFRHYSATRPADRTSALQLAGRADSFAFMPWIDVDVFHSGAFKRRHKPRKLRGFDGVRYVFLVRRQIANELVGKLFGSEDGDAGVAGNERGGQAELRQGADVYDGPDRALR